MSRRPTLPAAELRRFTGSPRAFIALIAAILVPLVYGAFYTWANESPQTRLDQVTAAVVNLDEPVTIKTADGKDQIVPLGRSVVGKLTSSDSSSNFTWVLTDAPAAAVGLAEGRYAAVLTIPADFSRSATSLNGPAADVRVARLRLETNDAVNYLDGALGRAIATATSAETSKTITEGYLTALYAGFGTLGDKLGSAADGAGELASGATSLSDGASKAATGAGQLADGASKVADGADALAVGAGKLATGAGQAADGARQLQVGTAPLVAGARDLASGATKLSSGAAAFAAGIDPLVAGSSQTAGGATSLQAGVTAYTQGIDGLAAGCLASGAAPAYCAHLGQVAGGGASLRSGAAGVAQGTSQVAGGVAQLRTGATQLGSSAATFGAGVSSLGAGVEKLGTGVGQLAGNLPALARGASELATGARALASGAEQAASGGSQLKNGVDALATGSAKLGTGATELSAGLGQAVANIPSYSQAERAAVAAVAAAPVTADATRINAVKNNGAGMAPYFMGLALWVGALAIFFLLRPLSPRALASSARSPLVALAGFLPAALLGVLQGVVLAVVLQWVVGISAANVVALVAICALVAVAFVAINQALVALLGTPGRFVGLILAGLQLASAGGTYTVETTPGFFQALHSSLPLTYAVDALRKVIAGSSVGLGQDIGVLVLSLGIGLAVTMYAAHRQRVWTLRRLHPVVVA